MYFVPLNSLNQKYKDWDHNYSQSLAIFRIVFFGYFFFFFFSNRYHIHLHVRLDYMWENSFWFDFFSVNRPNYSTLKQLYPFWCASLLFCSLGFFYRLSSVFAALYSLQLFRINAGLGGERYLFDYSTSQPVVIMIILMFSDANDSLSIDSWIKNKLGKVSRVKSPIEFAWTLLLLQIVISMPFFMSAANRILAHGFDQIFSHYFYELVNFSYYSRCIWTDTPGRFCSYLPLLIDNKTLLGVSYAFSQLIELSVPVAIFVRWLKPPIIFCLVLFQFLAGAVLFEFFWTFFPLFLIYARHVVIDWAKLCLYLKRQFKKI